MKINILKFSIIGLAMLTAGCAVGIEYRDAVSKIPAIKANQGRLIVYREFNPLTGLISRVLWVDGKPVGDLYGSAVIVHDITAGPHIINYNDGASKLDINMPAGGKVYLQYFIVSDSQHEGNTGVEIIPSKQAESDIAHLHYIETKIRHPDELKNNE